MNMKIILSCVAIHWLILGSFCEGFEHHTLARNGGILTSKIGSSRTQPSKTVGKTSTNLKSGHAQTSATGGSKHSHSDSQKADRFCQHGVLKKHSYTTFGASEKVLLCCPFSCGSKCGKCLSGGKDEECCAQHIMEKGKCEKRSAPCFIPSDPSLPSHLLHMLGEDIQVETSQHSRLDHSDPKDHSGIAFAVWASTPDAKAGAGNYVTKGKTKEVPEWTKFDAEESNMQKMITLNFESARLTHPKCRLVILTDKDTKFDTKKITPTLEGPPVEIFRATGTDNREEMISRMKARAQFLAKEKGDTDIVMLDTDMLVTKSMASVFNGDFDVAATWRHDIEMPINGGILWVKKSQVAKGQFFFEEMLAMTKSMSEKTKVRRWFGTSDQASLSAIMLPEFGYTGPEPGSPEGIKKLNIDQTLHTTFYPKGKDTGGDSIKMDLMPCPKYNGSGEKVKDRSDSGASCMKMDCCCSPDSAIIHFKGKLKEAMHTYWRDACNNPGMYKCATLKTKCEQVKGQKSSTTSDPFFSKHKTSQHTVSVKS